jgi:hypothetical protein
MESTVQVETRGRVTALALPRPIPLGRAFDADLRCAVGEVLRGGLAGSVRP